MGKKLRGCDKTWEHSRNQSPRPLSGPRKNTLLTEGRVIGAPHPPPQFPHAQAQAPAHTLAFTLTPVLTGMEMTASSPRAAVSSAHFFIKSASSSLGTASAELSLSFEYLKWVSRPAASLPQQHQAPPPQAATTSKRHVPVPCASIQHQTASTENKRHKHSRSIRGCQQVAQSVSSQHRGP